MVRLDRRNSRTPQRPRFSCLVIPNEGRCPACYLRGPLIDPCESDSEPGAPQSSVAVVRLRERVRRALTDGSRNNPLIYYRDSRASRFTIGALGSPIIERLLGGESLRRSDFEEAVSNLAIAVTRKSEAVPQSATPTEGAPAKSSGHPRSTRAADTDPLQSILRKIKAKAREHEEERGLRTLFATIGTVSWPATDGGRDPVAPLFLVPIVIVEDDRARGELIVRRLEEGEIVLNRALIAVAPPACANVLRELFDESSIEDVAAAYVSVETTLRSVPSVRVAPASAMGIFNFSLMAMIDDLDRAGDVLDAHPIVRAIAGDLAAQQQLRGEIEGAVEVSMLDAIPPIAEPFVLDADPWQASTIQTLLKYPNSHAIVEGPPGTGKSQTIGNLIAALIAQGKSVLFVCEKRAALDVVKRRLETVGLDHLVLDLHGADMTRRKIYAQLQRATTKLRTSQAASSAKDAELEVTRERLNEHVRTMHRPIAGAGMSTFELLGHVANLPKLDLSVRLQGANLAALDRNAVTELENLAKEAARNPELFLRKADMPWSCADLDEAAIAPAIDRVAEFPSVIEKLRAALRTIGIDVPTRTRLRVEVGELISAREILQVAAPSFLGESPETLRLAGVAFASSFAPIFALLPGARRVAMRAVRSHLSVASLPHRDCAALLKSIGDLDVTWRANLQTVASWTDEIDAAARDVFAVVSAAESALGQPLPEDLDAAIAWARTCGGERNGAFRSVRMREIERAFANAHLSALVAAFATLAPELWPKAVRYVWLNSYLDPLRPQLLRFDGRVHNDVVAEFVRLEAELRKISSQRVSRAAGERYIAIANTHGEQSAKVGVEIGRLRPRKPLRALFSESPDVMLSLAPCVMASPLSVSQLLPRATIFDVVVFDEGSQITPESAVTAIVRGHRVVVAGDEKQLPPTDFFRGTIESDDTGDDDESEDAIEGIESILGVLKPFCKPLGLRVHYRSRDERLIAFSNEHYYNNELVTFPGSGGSEQGLRFEYVPTTGFESDEESSSPEVARVVELILEHAETRPHETLGVIAFGSKHATSIESALFAARRERPDLDAFFNEAEEEPFFVKNLERVQGDERDAIILTVGYGKTKTGKVSHNFGPLNQDGGERRLNVAITRAKSRLTLVSSLKKIDLDPSKLVKRGSQLLAAYLGYVETLGRDLGRDGVDEATPANDFERDIQRALEERLGTGILAQYGVGQFRIDLAVQHPTQPGRLILAVECDGASYHSAPTARMRDRLRQNVLEGLGWTFCRIWSTDWFNDRAAEIDRVEAAYHSALARCDAVMSDAVPSRGPKANDASPSVRENVATRRGPSPVTYRYRSIADVPDSLLAALIGWITSDGLLYTDTELVEIMIGELGFARRGTRIVERLESAVAAFKNAER